MANLKSAGHHWWPECVSERWANPDGVAHRLAPDGTARPAPPKNFGSIGNGHHIKLSDDPGVSTPWDESFEDEFKTADDNFRWIIDWLNTLERCGPPFERSIASRICAPPVPDDKCAQLIECLVSLAVRSPMHREKSVALAEFHRGALPERKRNRLIGANIRHTHQNAVRSVAGSGKLMVIFSPEREFIFGDGFFSNLTVNGQHWNHPKVLVPLTPSISVLFVRPIGYSVLPRLVTLMASTAEAVELNYAVQVYSKNALFYRLERPELTEAFTSGKHRMFSDHHNFIEDLIHQIPGVPPRDESLDRALEFLRKYASDRTL